MQQVADPINQCSRAWDMGVMNRGGITNDLIPEGYLPPTTGAHAPDGKVTDQLGGPIDPDATGHYIPPLTACVVDTTVAVIPGAPETCARLGIPALES